jgi:uncharacterized membrane protein YkvA (DUF1232 family)
MQTSWFQRQKAKWKRDVAYVLCQARTLTLLLRHPHTPLPARLIAGCAAAYLLSPIQLIPTFIPVIGQMDDLFVLFFGMKFVRKLTPADVLKDCEQRAASRAAPDPEAKQELRNTMAITGPSIRPARPAPLHL